VEAVLENFRKHGFEHAAVVGEMREGVAGVEVA
jgi:hypothetical protein